MFNVILNAIKFAVKRGKFFTAFLILAVILLGGLLVIVKGTAISPFVYTLF